MKRFQKIVVPLDLTDADGGALRWGCRVAELASSSEIVFLHRQDLDEVSPETLEQFPWLSEPDEDKLLATMRERVGQSWQANEAQFHRFQLCKGPSNVLAILRATLDIDPDMVVVGKQAFGHDLAIRLARKAPCSVFVVPEVDHVAITKIAVPTDFSKYSAQALDVAVAFAKADRNASVATFHAYTTGSCNHRAMISEADLKAMTKAHVEDDHRAFIDAVDTSGVTVEREDRNSPLVCDAIISFIETSEADFAVIGCRGKNTVSALLLGSHAEALLKRSPIPVLAVKQKGTGTGLIRSLLS